MWAAKTNLQNLQYIHLYLQIKTKDAIFKKKEQKEM